MKMLRRAQEARKSRKKTHLQNFMFLNVPYVIDFGFPDFLAP